MQGVFYMRNSKGLFSTLAYFTMFIFGLQVCGQQFILLDIAEEYGMNNTAMGALSSIGFLAGLCSTVLLGGLIDKKNQRLLTAVCTAAIAVGGLLVLLVPNFIGLVAGLTLHGLAGALRRRSSRSCSPNTTLRIAAAMPAFPRCSTAPALWLGR